MAKIKLEYLDVDEKTLEGKPTKLTFCAQIEVSEYETNAPWLISDLRGKLTATFLQALAHKGVLRHEDISSYVPRLDNKNEGGVHYWR